VSLVSKFGIRFPPCYEDDTFVLFEWIADIRLVFSVNSIHWEKGLVSVLMKLFKKFKISSNGLSTEWVGYETLNLYTSFLIVETTPFFQ
jgi:hypothetical protein